MKTLEDLFLDQLAEMYDAEQEMARALSRMARLASNESLREALNAHAYESLGHISKVARLFECFAAPSRGAKSSSVSALLAEGDVLLAEHDEAPGRDSVIIGVVQKLEHYEIATYECLLDWATVLNNHEAVFRLEEILDEEKGAEHKLTDMMHLMTFHAPAHHHTGKLELDEQRHALAHGAA
jgi:ferritin-like metal-binding protein YciE